VEICRTARQPDYVRFTIHVLLYDFKGDVAKYFKTRVGVSVAGGNLQSAINFNNAHADVEMPFFNRAVDEYPRHNAHSASSSFLKEGGGEEKAAQHVGWRLRLF